jgi:hypothetical protein
LGLQTKIYISTILKLACDYIGEQYIYCINLLGKRQEMMH